jgi:phage recombination protein Bet
MSDIVQVNTWSNDRAQLDLIKRTFAAGTSDDEFNLFVGTCKRLGLDPFARQAFCVKRWDTAKRAEVAQTQVSIDGFRVVAERSGAYEGQTPPQWCGADGVWREVWLADVPPAAARVGVYRRGHRDAMYGIARYASFVQTKREGGPNRMWATMPDIMLAKCAEAQALRRAFPQDLSGIYTPDEMGQAENEDARIVPTLGEEERERSAAQVAAGAKKGGPSLAQGLIDHARAEINDLDTLRVWIAANKPAVLALGAKAAPRLVELLEKHALDVVEDLNAEGFRDEWTADEKAETTAA